VYLGNKKEPTILNGGKHMELKYEVGDRVIVDKEKAICTIECPTIHSIMSGTIIAVDTGATNFPYKVHIDRTGESFWSLSPGIIGLVSASPKRYSMAGFIMGNVVPWIKNDQQMENLLAAAQHEGLAWNGWASPTSYKPSTPCEIACGWSETNLQHISWWGPRGWHQAHREGRRGCYLPIEFEQLDLGDVAIPATKASVKPVHKSARRNEYIVAYYNPDGTVTCIHKKDGDIVETSTVARYYTDKDDLRVAAKYALEKMLGSSVPAEKSVEYKVGDRVRVHMDGGKSGIGTIAATNGPSLWPYMVRFPNGGLMYCAKDKISCPVAYADYIIGFVE
jgi:hypothetical protein